MLAAAMPILWDLEVSAFADFVAVVADSLDCLPDLGLGEWEHFLMPFSGVAVGRWTFA